MEIPKKFNIEELLRIAKENKEKLFSKDVAEELDDANKFVLALNIKVGKHKVLSGLIYDSYKAWRGNNAISKQAFFSRFSKIFETKRTHHNTFYLLNYKPANLRNVAEKKKVNV